VSADNAQVVREFFAATSSTQLGAANVVGMLFDARHSCRSFQDRPVDRATITQILELAQRSPSWCNTQPWQVYITEGEGTERLRAAVSAFAAENPPQPDLDFPARYDGVFLERRRACAWQLYESVGIEKGDRAASKVQTQKNFDLFGAPHVAVVTTERDLGVYGVLDCGVYLGHFLIAAQGLGVATIPQAALAAAAPVLRDQLGLSDDRQVLFGVSFGYADGDHPANGFRTERAATENVVTWVT
jgi:nitroreductase